jgi:hypothetical protein
VVAVLAIVAVRGAPRLRLPFGVLAYFIFSLTFASVLVRGSQVIDQLNGAPRYVYLQSLACLVLFVCLVEHFGPRVGHRAAGSWARSRRAIWAGIVIWYLGLNAAMGYFFVWQGSAARPSEMIWTPYVQSHPRNGVIIRDFFATLARLETEKATRDEIALTADKQNDWPITIGPNPYPRRRRSAP